ncbi:MAG: NAD(P)/FAD-dependent oxidoreductase [Flavobacteriales bacterium]|nr:NAD(P)/FAD-dependent oxidoreductase [Bacteroidota bacterium]MCB9241439.1 NAD(P)/FAD-dependent oxidoreductase [Flavobacteriales bacterium]
MTSHYQVLVIGAGTAGIMASAQLKKQKPDLSIGLIDPADTHYYQPAWTLVGANTYDFDETARPMKSLIPPGVNWIKEFAETFEPEQNTVKTRNGNVYTYDYLIVCPGIKIDPSLIDGLAESLDQGVVCSNYTDPKHTWEVLKNFKGGNALFTQPTTPIKCGGAPQKIAYLAADHIRKAGLADKSNVIFATPGSVIFGVKPIAKTLMEVINRYGIHFKPFHAPVHIDGKKKIATFKFSAEHANQCVVNEGNELQAKMVGETTIEIPFDMLHIAPPQTAPDFIRNSPFALETGWMNVNINTLQSPNYKNVFGLGDVAALPTAKTGAAIRKQVPVVVGNILHLMKDDSIADKTYNGYSSCPLVTGYGKMVLAEFDYDQNFMPDPKLKQMLVFNSDKEHWRLWILKKYILPRLYWNKMMKGIDV